MNIRCPLCKPSKPLKAQTLREALVAYGCDACSGIFLPSRNYLNWKATLKAEDSIDESSDENLVSDDTFDALICPKCKRIMLKYVVGKGIRFKIDFCRSCNGVWLDKNEWEILESKNLHREINQFFTEAWQSKERAAELEKRIEALFKERIGLESYDKVSEFKSWLRSTEFRTEILAYLQDDSSGSE